MSELRHILYDLPPLLPRSDIFKDPTSREYQAQIMYIHVYEIPSAGVYWNLLAAKSPEVLKKEWSWCGGRQVEGAAQRQRAYS